MRKMKFIGVVASAAFGVLGCALPNGPLLGQTGAAPVPANSVAGTYLAASLAAAEGDVSNAARFYNEMLKKDPGNPDLLERSFVFAASGGDLATAIPLAQRIVLLDPDNRRAHLVLAVAALENKNYELALDEIALAGRGPLALLTNSVVEAWATEGLGRTDDAIGIIDRLNGQMGIEGLQAFHRALILDHSGRGEQADAAYKRALQLVGQAPRTNDAYGRFLRRQGRVEEAKALYLGMARGAANPVAKIALAEIAGNRPALALVEEPAHGAAEGLFAIAASFNAENSTDAAILYLNLALHLRPDLDLASALLGDRYERGNQFQMANDIYARISPRSPYHALVQVQSALNLGRMDRANEAVDKLKLLTVQEPENVDVQIALADLSRSAGRDEDAIATYGKAISLLPEGDGRIAGLHFARGVAYQSLKRWDDGERDFTCTLALSPERADALNHLGYSWVDRGKNLEEALRMLEKARMLRPRDGYIADSVGWAYFKLGRYHEAAEILEEAVQLAPGISEMNDHLGDAYWRVGRKLDARFEWSHALQLGPEPGMRPIIERKLQMGLDAAVENGT